MKTHQSVIYSSLLTFFIFIICVFVFKIQYEANDDRIMQLILNGTLTNGTPDYHSVFNNVIFGFLVSKLYEIIPSIEWYPIALLSFLFIANFTLNYIVFKYTNGAKKIALVLLSLVSVWFITNLQFTSVTTYSAFAAYLIFVIERDNRLKWISIILLFLSSLIRLDMFLLLSLCIIPFIIINQFKRENIKYTVVLIGLIMSAHLIHLYAYKLDGWDFYSTFNFLRGKLNDNPNLNIQSEEIKKLLSENDLILYRLFIYSDDIKLSTLEQIWHFAKGNIFNYKNFTRTLINFRIVFSITILFAGIHFYKKNYGITLFAIIFFALIYYISINHYAKDRIVYPMVFVYSFLSIFYLDLKNKFVFYFIILFMIFKLKNYDFYLEKLNYHKKTNTNEKILEEIKNNDKIYLITPVSISFIITNDPFLKVPNNIFTSGWLTNSPLLKSHPNINYHQNILNTTGKNKEIEFISSEAEFKKICKVYINHFTITKKINNIVFYKIKR